MKKTEQNNQQVINIPETRDLLRQPASSQRKTTLQRCWATIQKCWGTDYLSGNSLKNPG